MLLVVVERAQKSAFGLLSPLFPGFAEVGDLTLVLSSPCSVLKESRIKAWEKFLKRSLMACLSMSVSRR